MHHSFVRSVIVCSQLAVYYFQKEQFMEQEQRKNKYETQKLKKNENYERMNEMQTRDDRNEMNEPTK